MAGFNYTFEDLEKILGFTSWSDKRKIDALLHIDCIMYANLGIDSTKGEREEVKKKSRALYRAIKILDDLSGESLLHAMDKK